MEWIIPMTAGLLLDICGAYLIVKAFLFSGHFLAVNQTYSSTKIESYWDESKRPNPYNIDIDRDMFLASLNSQHLEHTINNAKWGFGFLFSGFALQIIGNMINYYNNSF